MSNLRSRLLKAQAILGAPETREKDQSYKKMTIQELDQEIVPQGKNKGMAFLQLWENDRGYIVWATTGLPRQDPWMALHHYIELKIAEMEKEAALHPPKAATKIMPKPKMRIPPSAESVKVDSDEEDGWEQATMMAERASASSPKSETQQPDNKEQMLELSAAISGMMGMLQNIHNRLEQVEYRQHQQQ